MCVYHIDKVDLYRVEKIIMTKNLLVINPNSSKSITDNLAVIIGQVPGFKLDYMTGPSSAPAEISDEKTSLQSTKACLPIIKEKYMNYDGYVVCCFSDHPLVKELKKIVEVPVEGIFQASIHKGVKLSSIEKKVAILTSTKSWEPLLDASLLKLLELKKFPDNIVPTLAAEVSVLELSSPEKFNQLKSKVQTLVDQGVSIIILGCAGLSGLDKKFDSVFPDITFIDPVVAAVDTVVDLNK